MTVIVLDALLWAMLSAGLIVLCYRSDGGGEP